jgi:tetratricopeptide (TPR) repeat protein
MNVVRAAVFSGCVLAVALSGWSQPSRAEQVQWQSGGCRGIVGVTTNSNAEAQAYALLRSAQRKYLGWNEDCSVRVGSHSDYWQAFQDLNQAIELNPNLAKAYYVRGLLQEREFNKSEKALADYNKALALDPSIADAYFARGLLRLSADAGGAAEDFQKAIAINPTYARGYYGLGLVYGKIRGSHDALEKYSYAIHLNDKFAQAYYQRGLLQEDRLKNDRAALADYKRAVAINPNYFDAQSKLAFLRWKMSRPGQDNSGLYQNAIHSARNGPTIQIQEALELFEEL